MPKLAIRQIKTNSHNDQVRDSDFETGISPLLIRMLPFVRLWWPLLTPLTLRPSSVPGELVTFGGMLICLAAEVTVRHFAENQVHFFGRVLSVRMQAEGLAFPTLGAAIFDGGRRHTYTTYPRPGEIIGSRDTAA